MKTVTSISQLKTEIRVFKAMGLSIGFVPTMGALHDGHRSLIQKSTKNNDVTIVSIYVNPTQFNDKNDFENYPTSIDEDKKMLSEENVALLFLPEYQELYPDSYRYKITENNLSQRLCGAHRPGHFDGVLTVVLKLLNLVEADHAYFGEKDFQQFLLIKKMTEAFFLKTQIAPCPTIREADGLAMSSRNRRLTAEQRKLAALFPQILSQPGLTLEERREKLKSSGCLIDYIEEIGDRRFGAIRIGDVRLIDNFQIRQEVMLEASNPL